MGDAIARLRRSPFEGVCMNRVRRPARWAREGVIPGDRAGDGAGTQDRMPWPVTVARWSADGRSASAENDVYKFFQRRPEREGTEAASKLPIESSGATSLHQAGEVAA